MHLSINNVRVIFSFFSVILSIFFIGYCLFKGRKTKLLSSYIFLQTTVALWSVGRGWGLLATDLQSKWLAQVLSFFATCYVGYSWLLFCGLYTEIPLFLKKRNLWLLLAPPSLSYLFLLTIDYRHLLPSFPLGFAQFGILYWFHVAVTYIYVLMGIALMIKYAIRQMKDSRAQSILLIFSALIPLLMDLLAELQIIIKIEFLGPFVDLTPFSLSLSVLLYGVVSFKYRFLNIIPVAWQKIIDHMKESMMIIDRTDTVVNYNHSFEKDFSEFVQTGSGELNKFTEQLDNRRQNNLESAQIITAIKGGATGALSGELTLIYPEWKCFSVYIQSILSKRGEVQGRIVLFNDITHDKKLLRELHDKNTVMSVMNQELATANEQLIDYARTVKELAVAQERNRIARDIHDSVGHNMTLLITLLELTTDLYDQHRPETRTKLVEATGVARESLQELRRSIRHQTQIGDLLESLDKLTANFEASGIQINFSVEGITDPLQPQYSEVIYRICQEALTNAVRHGAATQVTMVLRFNGQIINLSIFDNGQGCQKITKGMGLTGMEQRVQELNGTIEYGVNGEDGFNINVEIPIN